MTIDPTSFEERRYTRQHDRVFHAVVQQVQELDTRLRYLEQLLEPRAEESPEEVREIVAEVRASSSSLAERIASIGEALESVVDALDTSHHPANTTNGAAPATTPTPPAVPQSVDDDDVIVDLDSERRRKPAWRSAAGRGPGWLPVTNP